MDFDFPYDVVGSFIVDPNDQIVTVQGLVADNYIDKDEASVRFA